MNTKENENLVKEVYGNTFSRYDEQSFLEFLKPLEIRLKNNNISLDIFKGKRCLDAGCGGGRSSVLMAKNGAKEVIAYDFSDKNLHSTLEKVKQFNLKNVEVKKGTLLNIPFDDERFDLVWCNGVIHHTSNPDQSLSEVYRVLRQDGFFWLYLYGSGGLYWEMIFFLRDWLKEINMSSAISHLVLLGEKPGKIAEYIDDWFVPYLKTYSHQDILSKLKSLGDIEIKRLWHGMNYDTSERVYKNKENEWFGEGDLRYWIQKRGKMNKESNIKIPDFNERGSKYKESANVLQSIETFKRIASNVIKVQEKFPDLGIGPKISIAAGMQKELRNRMSMNSPFDGKEFMIYLENLNNDIKNLLI